jgi:hypothetical protein
MTFQLTEVFRMRTIKLDWIFYVVVAGVVILNEIASSFGIQIITFVLLLVAVIWAGSRFLSREKSDP